MSVALACKILAPLAEKMAFFSLALKPLMSFSTKNIKAVATKLKTAKSEKVQPAPSESNRVCVTKAKIKTQLKSTKFAHAIVASAPISPTYVKKKLP